MRVIKTTQLRAGLNHMIINENNIENGVNQFDIDTETVRL